MTDDSRYFWRSRRVRDPRAGWWAFAATAGFLLIVLLIV